MLDMCETIEQRWLERGHLTPNEFDGLTRMHKQLVNAEATDAETDALSQLTALQGNRLDTALEELLGEVIDVEPEKPQLRGGAS
jgi:hypothetical protein